MDQTNLPENDGMPYLGKLLRIPGVKQAIDQTLEFSSEFALIDILELAEKNEFGKHIQKLARESTMESFEAIFKSKQIKAFYPDSYWEWREDLSFYVGPKIAEIWNLSEKASTVLTDAFRLGNEFPERLSFVITQNKKRNPLIKPDKPKVDLVIDKFQNDHLYLDVSYLSFSKLKAAYKSILLFRNVLDIKGEDLKEGAPKTVNIEKALEAYGLLDSGVKPKQIATKLGFRVYSRDNPSGSYPLARKYIKLGKEVSQKLEILYYFTLDAIKEIIGDR